ncbi:ABC transporter ATP-binding protein [Microvirga sp. VF16]|uniref:dipeptide ABC transporter ATP-binding protein n=1 Tax=Microvirga sp. VF16 TaxID=2807101 RepID=UPI001FED83F5|nr:ABC transporter ATP-binding protein [Microvirga sp. VF16]
MTSLLDVQNLEILFGSRRIVDGLSFSLAPGATVALIGESGSGKSITAAAILGLLPPGMTIGQTSKIVLKGERISPFDEATMAPHRGRTMSIVFQDPMSCLNPFMTVGAQIDESLRRIGMRGTTARRARIFELMRLVELPEPPRLAARYPHQLSGGQQQRIMIAMALAAEPELLIADEPTSALDATVQAEILALLKRLQAKLGNAMIFITHDLAAAANLAERIIVMQRGRAVEQGSVARILRSPTDAYTRTLVSTRTMLTTQPPEPPHGSQTVLAIENVVYDYSVKSLFARPFRALHGVSTKIKAGETLGVLGESGSGKSTLAKLVVGLAAPMSGEITLFGELLSRNCFRLTREQRRRCQIVFQNPFGALNPRLTIEQAMREPLDLLGLSRADDRARLEAVLHDVKLGPEHLGRYPHQLSGGQRQRVCIARALLSEPDLLICDEIVSALDATVQMQVLRMLKDLQAKRGFAMLFIGHDIEIVRWVSDRIAVMRGGRIVEQGPASQIVEAPRENYTRAFMAAMPRPFAAGLSR